MPTEDNYHIDLEMDVCEDIPDDERMEFPRQNRSPRLLPLRKRIVSKEEVVEVRPPDLDTCE